MVLSPRNSPLPAGDKRQSRRRRVSSGKSHPPPPYSNPRFLCFLTQEGGTRCTGIRRWGVQRRRHVPAERLASARPQRSPSKELPGGPIRVRLDPEEPAVHIPGTGAAADRAGSCAGAGGDVAVADELSVVTDCGDAVAGGVGEDCGFDGV